MGYGCDSSKTFSQMRKHIRKHPPFNTHFMYVFFLISYVLQYDSIEMQEKLLNMSWKIPILVFCYSPFCGICQSIHPKWDNLSKIYRDDPHIMLAEIDCTLNKRICTKYYGVSAFPHFVKILKANSKITNIDISYDSIHNKIKELANLNMSELCERYPKEEQNYPTIVISKTTNHFSCCQLIDNVTKSNPALLKYFTAKDHQEEDKVEAFITKNISIRMKDPINIKNIYDFVNEYKSENFGYLKWSEVLSKTRKIIILIVKRINDTNPFIQVSNENSEKYYWSRITASKYLEFESKVDESNLPAAIISNDSKSKYAIIYNVTPETIMSSIEKPLGSHGKTIHKNMNKVFIDYKLFPGMSKNMRNAIYILVAALIFILVFNIYWSNREPALKFE